MSLKFEKIEIERINEIISILVEKAKYLNSINKTMWDIHKLTKEKILKQYNNPLLFLVIYDEKILGCFILIEKDEKNWPESKDDEAYYLHRLVVRTDFCGKGYSKNIIDWIKEYAKNNNKDYVRIDYDKKREYLDKLYKLNGFVDVGEYEIRPGLILTKSEYKIKNLRHRMCCPDRRGRDLNNHQT